MTPGHTHGTLSPTIPPTKGARSGFPQEMTIQGTARLSHQTGRQQMQRPKGPRAENLPKWGLSSETNQSGRSSWFPEGSCPHSWLYPYKEACYRATCLTRRQAGEDQCPGNKETARSFSTNHMPLPSSIQPRYYLLSTQALGYSEQDKMMSPPLGERCN